MDITVSGRKTTVTDALRAHVDEKIGGALKVFDIEPMTADVVLRYEKNPANPEPAIVEVTVRARGSVIRVAEHGVDMYSAIDLAADKVTLIALGNADVPVGQYSEEILTNMRI